MAATREAALGSTTTDWTDYVHTGPGTLAGRYMRLFWQPVYRSADLPAGRAKPIRIMGEDFTLYRGEAPLTSTLPRPGGGSDTGVTLPGKDGGRAHLLAFRCAHRGTQLSTGWVEGDELRCFYHGWKYGPDGQCVEQPAEPEPFCGRIKIRSYPVQEYLGLIFAYLGEGEPPELPRYPDFEKAGTLRIGFYVRECNYFNNIENGIDPAHLPFTHRGTLARPESLATALAMSCRETDFGVVACRGGAERQGMMEEYGMPNVLFRLGPSSGDALAWRVPIDDQCHASFQLFLKRQHSAEGEQEWVNEPEPSGTEEVARAVLAGDRVIEDFTDRRDFVNVQDSVAQAGQGLIPNRQIDHLGHSDQAVIEVRRVWTRELRALAEGRPLKKWAHPGNG